MILSFILGIVFGLVSSFIKDGSSAVKYVMSNTNQINYDKIDILDSCINGNEAEFVSFIENKIKNT